MRNIVHLGVAAALVAILFYETPSQSPADRSAIEAIATKLEQGWNSGSGLEFAAPFAENSDYVVINGMHLKGRRENAAGHQRIFDTVYKDSRLRIRIESIRMLRPDVAIAHLNAFLRPAQPAGREDEARITLVLTKTGRKWEIAAFQNTAVQASPQGLQPK